MANELAKLFVSLSANTDDFTKGMKDAQKNMEKAGKVMMGVGLGITAALAGTVKAANDERVGINRLSQQLKNVNVDYKQVESSLESLISTTQQKTGIADDQQRVALGDLITVTGDYQKALELLPLALDLAASKEMDVSTAAELVGRVAEGNVTVLKRYGIELDETATAADALATLQQRVGGTAEAAKDPIKLLQNNLSDVAETIGGALLGDADKFLDKVNEIVLQAIDWIKQNQQLVRTIGAVGLVLVGAGGVIFAIRQVAQTIALVNTALAIMQGLSGPKGWITLGVGAAATVGAIAGINHLMNQAGKDIPEFASGGVVPGAIGEPQLAVVHGGEYISPVGQTAGVSINVSQMVIREEADIEKTARAFFRMYQTEMRLRGA